MVCACAAVSTMPEKPNYIIPTPNPDPSTVLSAKKELQELCNMKDAEKSPAERMSLPCTGNQEYGFFHQPLVRYHGISWVATQQDSCTHPDNSRRNRCRPATNALRNLGFLLGCGLSALGWIVFIQLAVVQVRVNPMFAHPRVTCDVGEYADAYTEMTGTSPFARKDGSGE